MSNIFTYIKKYYTFIIYLVVAISSMVIDEVLFIIFNKVFLLKIMIATIIARVFSSLYNYLLNRNKVFKDNQDTKKTMIEYYILVVITMLLSGGLVTIFDKIIFFLPTFLIKLIVDGCLFIMNYFIQKLIIFKKTSN